VRETGSEGRRGIDLYLLQGGLYIVQSKGRPRDTKIANTKGIKGMASKTKEHGLTNSESATKE